MYFSMLAKVLRPSVTPCSRTIRLFSSRIISAASLAISTAESTEIPMSAARSAGASLMPSPIKPTTCPSPRSTRTMRSLCIGVSLANTVVSRATFSSCTSSSASISLPITTLSACNPTSLQTLRATSGLSPVRIFTVTPLRCSASSAGAVLSFGGSRNAIYPARIRPDSSVTP